MTFYFKRGTYKTIVPITQLCLTWITKLHPRKHHENYLVLFF